MTDKEYLQTFAKARQLIEENAQPFEGDKAVEYLSRACSDVCWIFNVPGYKGVPVTPSPSEGTYGYSVNGVRLHRENMNRMEMVVCNKAVSFVCVFNHEWQAFCPELWFGEHV